MNQDWPEEPGTSDDELVESKTQRKQQMTALQKLGEELTGLKPAQLDRFELDPALRAAIAEYQRLPNRHEARRRQMQFIGKLMRKADGESIRQQLEALRTPGLKEVRRGQTIAHWIERLETGEDQDVFDFLEQYPEAERQPLRQLVRNCRRHESKEPHRERLLDFIRATIH